MLSEIRMHCWTWTLSSYIPKPVFPEHGSLDTSVKMTIHSFLNWFKSLSASLHVGFLFWSSNVKCRLREKPEGAWNYSDSITLFCSSPMLRGSCLVKCKKFALFSLINYHTSSKRHFAVCIYGHLIQKWRSSLFLLIADPTFSLPLQLYSKKCSINDDKNEVFCKYTASSMHFIIHFMIRMILIVKDCLF